MQNNLCIIIKQQTLNSSKTDAALKVMIRKKHILLFLGLFMFIFTANAQQRVAVKNNLLYDATLTPNLSLEYWASPRWSWQATVGYNPWWHHGDVKQHSIFRSGDSHAASDYVQWRHLLGEIDARYWWFKPERIKENETLANGFSAYRYFLSMGVMGTHYNIGNVKFPFGLYKKLRSERRQGDAVALSLGIGRVWRLSDHWWLEAELGVYAGYAWFDRYQCNHCGTKLGKDDKPFLAPKAALSIVYRFGKPEKAPEVIPVIIPVDTVQPEPPFVPVLALVPEFTGVAGRLAETNGVLQHISQYRPYDDTRILRREAGALYVHFPLDKTDLRRDFRDNATSLDQIMNVTRLIMADTTSMVKKIQIIGLASFEGRLPHNKDLAGGRALALQKYVQNRLEVPDSLFETINGGEAWAEFRDQIEELKANLASENSKVEGITVKELDEILNIIETESNLDRREQLIKRMRGGRTYQYLKRSLLADQRNSGYMRIYWDYVPDKQAEIINNASELLAHEQYDEALSLLRSVSYDKRSYNALAVALYMTDNKEEAIRYFRLAAENGNAQAKENLRQLKTHPQPVHRR